jgi:hypothetical protein
MILASNPSVTLQTLGSTAVVLSAVSVTVVVTVVFWRLSFRLLGMPLIIIATLIAAPFVLVALIILCIAELIAKLIPWTDYSPLKAAYGAATNTRSRAMPVRKNNLIL